MEFRGEYFAASQRHEAAKAHSKKLLEEAKVDGDKTIQKYAKGITKETAVTIACWFIVLGFLLCFLLVPLGVTVIVIGGILCISHGIKARKLRKKLAETSPDFKRAFEEEKAAEKNLEDQKYLYDMVTFIEKYEAQHGIN